MTKLVVYSARKERNVLGRRRESSEGVRLVVDEDAYIGRMCCCWFRAAAAAGEGVVGGVVVVGVKGGDGGGGGLRRVCG